MARPIGAMGRGSVSEKGASADTILKILSGVQAGVEVSLVGGEYLFGSGDADDIQIVDVSLRPGHAKLRVSPGKIEVAGAAGSLRTANGVALDAGSEWQEIEPLDIVIAGTTRFALGPPTANWASIAEDDTAPEARPARAAAALGAAEATLGRTRLVQMALALAGLVALIGLLAWQLSLNAVDSRARAGLSRTTDLEIAREVVARLPFANAVEVRQEVDGTIYVSGYVDSVVERRAVVAAVEKTQIPARVRIWVLQTIRAEVESLARAEGVNVSFELSPRGELTLDGLILNDAAAARFVGLVGDRLLGLAGVTSRIRTASTLLAEAERLAQASGIQPWVMLRVDRELIEANGAVPAEKVDAWVGFLQAYARRLSKQIALRSFVQLQSAGAAASPAAAPSGQERPIVIGAQPPGGSGSPLDLDRLMQGNFALTDVFASERRPAEAPTPASATSPSPSARPVSVAEMLRDGALAGAVAGAVAEAGAAATRPAAPDQPGEVRRAAERVAEGPAATPSAPRQAGSRPDEGVREAGRRPAAAAEAAPTPPRPVPAEPPAQARAGNDRRPPAAAPEAPARPAEALVEAPAERARPARPGTELSDLARGLLEQWRDGRVGPGDSGRALHRALDLLHTGRDQSRPPGAAPDAGERRDLVNRYLPLINAGGRRTDAAQACWPGATLTLGKLGATLFWLDILSVTDAATLKSFDRDTQTQLLEAALNPRLVKDCAARLEEGSTLVARSLYLGEVARNPGFVRFIVRDLQPFLLDVTGVSLASRERFIQIRSGRKLHEGAAPDGASRIALVGELGVAIQLREGFSAVVFGPEVSWSIQ